MKRLSGLDASFLYLETPTSHMHVASCAVFDPSTVEVVERDLQALEEVEAGLGLAQVERGGAGDDVLAVRQELAQQFRIALDRRGPAGGHQKATSVGGISLDDKQAGGRH